MLFTDVKYAQYFGSRVRNFSQPDHYVWNFSCPVCGDSRTNTRKARGYIYRDGSGLKYKCHNCGFTSTIGALLKRIAPDLYSEYQMESLQDNVYKERQPKPDFTLFGEVNKPADAELATDSILSTIPKLSSLPETHPAYQYAINRKLPDWSLDLLYFTPGFKKYTNSILPNKFKSGTPDEPRMIIPSFDVHGMCVAFAGRAYGAEEPKYFTIKLAPEYDKVFGLERVDYSKPILVVEGQLDSLFLPNALAVEGASFDVPAIQRIKANCTLVMDNEPRNKDIVSQLHKYIKSGYRVVVYPGELPGKDINELVLNGMPQEDIIKIIEDNSFSGIEAEIKFSQWRKV